MGLLVLWNNKSENAKLQDVKTVFKGKNPLEKKPFRPVSVLPLGSKFFEGWIKNEINKPIKFN